mmetsp:Transcript_21046/g.52185  ORF Transcript_21046/g.52185 Transcript_21046/m.52185 type:complete len:241 (+) Transcript_21046:60-782(+)
MKAPTTSIIYTLLCLSLNLESASAIFGFSFSNLLFALNICHMPGPGICSANCDPGPLPPGPKDFCDNSCGTTEATRRLTGGSTIRWTKAACSSFSSDSEAYYRCMTQAVTDCAETSTDADLTYTPYNATSYNGTTSSVEGTNTNGITTTIVSRASFLPYMLAASVSAMFVILYAWKKRQKKEELLREDLMGDDDSNQSFHGSVARRIGRARSSAIPNSLPTVIEMEGPGLPRVTTGYAMA